MSRDVRGVASWWGPALSIRAAADPPDTSRAVALHHARLWRSSRDPDLADLRGATYCGIREHSPRRSDAHPRSPHRDR